MLPRSQWMQNLPVLEERLGYRFASLERLEEATIHKSFTNETKKGGGRRDNERLEFLGDTILGLVVAENLMRLWPDSPEGVLSKIKGRIVSEPSLAQVARNLSLGTYLLIGRGEEMTQGREKNSILSDALEAVIAAIYQDGGLEAARQFILREFRELFESASRGESAADYKTLLQEYCQRELDTLPQYVIVGQSGPDHQKVFDVAVRIRDRVWGEGQGHSKKEAEQKSAKSALERIAQTTTDLPPPHSSPGLSKRPGG
ncbi:MAG: ribonuclease III [Leptospirillia bacterium]